MNTDDTKNEAAEEALAIRHVLQLDLEERPEKLAEIGDATRHLVQLHKAITEAITEAAALTVADVLAMLERSSLQKEAELCRHLFDQEGADPKKAAKAYANTLANAAERREQRRRRDAMDALAKADAATDADDRASFMERAMEHLHPSRKFDREPLADLWNRHRAQMFTKDEAGPRDAVQLDSKNRGQWAGWFNRWLGPRGGLEPGRTLLLGGGPGGGKTSLAAALAVDAVAADCPVLFWQLELSRNETLEHLMAQLPGEKGWQERKFLTRANRELPEAWAELLEMPRADDLVANEAETIRDAMRRLARRAKNGPHACRGLVIVDYMQLLTVRNRGPRDAGHEVLTTAASLLAKAAAEADVALVLLSQMTKADPSRKGEDGHGTGFSGADLERMAHAAAIIGKDKEDGDLRVVQWVKDRGRLGFPDRKNVLKVTPASRAFMDADETTDEKTPW